MTMAQRQVRFAASAMVLLATSVSAHAQAQQEPATTPGAGEEVPLLFPDHAVEDAVLARTAGREDRTTWQSASAVSNSRTENNKVGDNSPTGALNVSDSAFQNVAGISMVNLNTGNASSINASLNVNLTITMAPPSTGGM